MIIPKIVVPLGMSGCQEGTRVLCVVTTSLCHLAKHSEYDIILRVLQVDYIIIMNMYTLLLLQLSHSTNTVGNLEGHSSTQ